MMIIMMIIMNSELKKNGKWLWCNFRYYTGICLGGEGNKKKNTEILRQDGPRAEVRVWNVKDTLQEL
jgi:hypothetical protein